MSSLTTIKVQQTLKLVKLISLILEDVYCQFIALRGTLANKVNESNLCFWLVYFTLDAVYRVKTGFITVLIRNSLQ